MFVYILKSTVCLVLLLGFYHLVLEKEKMHQFNRFYLLGSVVFSLIVPSFIITVTPTEFAEPIINKDFKINSIQNVTAEVNYTIYFLYAYTIISSILFLFFGKNIIHILQKIKKNKKVSYFKATVVLLKEQVLPHTFLNYIFINKKEYQTHSLEQQILTHELTHVEQKHTLDVLFIQVLQNLFWFNPIFRFYKKAIQLNHEFLADDAVINSHKNISEYQQLLLSKTAQNNNIYLASNFNYSLTKKRLLMMTTPSSKTKILLKKLLILPLTAGFIFAFAQRVEAQEKKKKDLPQVVEVTPKEKGLSRKGMKEYQRLFNSAKEPKIYKRKDISRMVTLYKAMSKKQQQSVTDIRKVIPPPPPIDLVYTYNRLGKRINSTSKNRKANVEYLYQLYNKMNASQKRKVKNPSSIIPPPPPPKPVKIKVIEKESKNKKSRKNNKPASITVVDKIDKDELVEVIEVEEKEERPEIIEIKEEVEEAETEVVEEIEEIKEEIIETPEVVEILENEGVVEDEIVNLQSIQKSNLRKEYYINNKKVSERKFNRLNFKKIKKLRIKKGDIYKIYITTKN
jgi:hypothetical protein